MGTLNADDWNRCNASAARTYRQAFDGHPHAHSAPTDIAPFGNYCLPGHRPRVDSLGDRARYESSTR
jgi:hypothetical protein